MGSIGMVGQERVGWLDDCQNIRYPPQEVVIPLFKIYLPILLFQEHAVQTIYDTIALHPPKS